MARIKKVTLSLEMLFQMIRWLSDGEDEIPEDSRLVEVQLDEKDGTMDIIIGANEYPECNYSSMGKIGCVLDPDRMHVLAAAIKAADSTIEDRSRKKLTEEGGDDEPEIKVRKKGE